jgi:hypothetical protein
VQGGIGKKAFGFDTLISIVTAQIAQIFKRAALSQRHIQPDDGSGWNTNVKQATIQSYRESCRHHGIRLYL